LQAAAVPTNNALPMGLFPLHLNAPKLNLLPQDPLYGRMQELMLPLPLNLLIQTMHRATQMCVMPNSLPCFSTIYRSTTQDISVALGPMPIFFSINSKQYSSEAPCCGHATVTSAGSHSYIKYAFSSSQCAAIASSVSGCNIKCYPLGELCSKNCSCAPSFMFFLWLRFTYECRNAT
jgi:hypothetical protein